MTGVIRKRYQESRGSNSIQDKGEGEANGHLDENKDNGIVFVLALCYPEV